MGALILLSRWVKPPHPTGEDINKLGAKQKMGVQI